MGNTVHQRRDKAGVRSAMTAARGNLSVIERRQRSRRVVSRCRELAGFSTADLICTYVNFRDEVETTGLIADLLAEGRRIVVPCHRSGTEPPLVFSEIRSLSEMAPNPFGILQPPLVAARLVPTAAIPVFLVPGLAFDPTGHRLGYGLGCYDRAFAAAAPDALKVGLAFELQILEAVPADPHDVPMDVVVTEDRVIHAADGAGSPTRRW